MPAVKKVCQTIYPWLRGNDHAGVLGALTGQDHRALEAFVHLMELFSVSDGPGRAAAVNAMHFAVEAMQPKCRDLCYQAIAHVLDWGDRDRLWPLILSQAGHLLDDDPYGLARKIASEPALMKFKAVRCRKCGREQPYTSQMATRFFVEGWPICCDETMEMSQITRARPEGGS